jgi:hypothetical protein
MGQQIPALLGMTKKSPPSHALLYSAAGDLEEVGGADESQDGSDYEGEAVAGGVVDYGGGREMMFCAAGF